MNDSAWTTLAAANPVLLSSIARSSSLASPTSVEEADETADASSSAPAMNSAIVATPAPAA